MQMQTSEFPLKQVKKTNLISKEFIEKNFPDLNLQDEKGTIRKLQNLLKNLAGSQKYVEDLAGDETEGSEELSNAYESYKEAIEKILPPGYEMEEEKTIRYSDLWRGADPLAIFSLLSDKNNTIKISSSFPNVAHKWSTSLGYGYGRETVNLPFVLAFGFKRPKNFITSARKNEDAFKDVIESATGKINFNDVKEIAIRLKGKEPGKVFPPKFYRLNKVEKEALAA
ncbi:MAG: hypothetical protein WC460_01995 [Patescibacteria group bacterium]